MHFSQSMGFSYGQKNFWLAIWQATNSKLVWAYKKKKVMIFSFQNLVQELKSSPWFYNTKYSEVSRSDFIFPLCNLKTLPSSDSSFHLAVGWQCLSQVDPHCQSILLAGMFLMDLRLQLVTLSIKAIQGCEGKWFLCQEALQSFTPAFQHGAAYLRRNWGRSPEDLRRQNLEATVVQDAILQEKRIKSHISLAVPVWLHWTFHDRNKVDELLISFNESKLSWWRQVLDAGTVAHKIVLGKQGALQILDTWLNAICFY